MLLNTGYTNVHQHERDGYYFALNHVPDLPVLRGFSSVCINNPAQSCDYSLSVSMVSLPQALTLSPQSFEHLPYYLDCTEPGSERRGCHHVTHTRVLHDH